jgi:hypothetical protein
MPDPERGTDIERPACFGSFRRRAVKQPTCTWRRIASTPQAHCRRIFLAANRIALRARRLRFENDACVALECSERSYLFTMSDIARAEKPLEKRCGSTALAEHIFLRTGQSPAGGARRDRTDDLLLAKQALSQLSYGPVRGSGISNQ